MTTKYGARFVSPDLLAPSSSVSLPQTFQMTPGSTIDITFQNGRTGTMTITGEPRPGIHRGHWASTGSTYDGREFDLWWGTKSDLAVPGEPIMIPVIMNVVP
jgi:hypothetical protein